MKRCLTRPTFLRSCASWTCCSTGFPTASVFPLALVKLVRQCVAGQGDAVSSPAEDADGAQQFSAEACASRFAEISIAVQRAPRSSVRCYHLIAALCMPLLLRSSSMAAGSAFVPIQSTPFVFPTFPINPASYSPSAEWTCPHLPERLRSLPRRRGPCAGDHAGWKPPRGEVMRWRAAERTPAWLCAALLSMGLGLGALAGAGWVVR